MTQHDHRARFCKDRADGTEWTTGIRCLVCDPIVKRPVLYTGVAREVLTELAEAMRTGVLEYGPGNASVAIRDWMEENYPEA